MKSIVLCDNAEPEKVVPLCREYGLGIEIQGFYNPNTEDGAQDLTEKYQKMLDGIDERHLHAPFWDLCLASKTKMIRDVTRHYFDYGYQMAAALNCRSVTVHQGFVPGTSYVSGWVKRAIPFWEEFFNEHPGHIEMNMENLCEKNAETLIGTVDGLGVVRLGVNLDIGHAHCMSDLEVTDWIEQLGGRIHYAHLHQNDGTKDKHWGLAKGTIPLDEVLGALNQYAPNAVWALECAPDDMQESIEFLVAKGFVR
ncbi:MAG: sugar phosphate isomerase/epimerase [Clostridiales bacterium]|nr:sugar phosphate isomerase/epimerase [Clostridiales bacterium]